MRSYGALNPLDQIPMPPDTVQTKLLASSVAESDQWAGSTEGSSEFGAHIVRFTGFTSGASSGGVPLAFMVNLISTYVLNPTQGTSIDTKTTVGSSGVNIPVYGSKTFQIPQYSTGYSVITIGAGYVFAEIWRK
jgi:hypothetical protein